MQIIKANIWRFIEEGYIVVPTNGTVKENGECVMGAGLAQQAKLKYPHLPKKLGSMIKSVGNWPFVWYGARIITFPVKHNWFENANLELIEKSASALAHELSKEGQDEWKVYMPKVGCGNGHLNWKDVEPIIEKYLGNKVIIVDRT